MSDFLFAIPDWKDGLMSIVDLFGVSQEYNSSNSEEEADSRAFNADVMSLRIDANKALNKARMLYAK